MVVHCRSPSQKETVVLPEQIFPLLTTQIIIERSPGILQTVHTQSMCSRCLEYQTLDNICHLFVPDFPLTKCRSIDIRNSHCTQNEEKAVSCPATIKTVDKEI